ncbi:alkylation response protein AidB-like acyl-CoA dehydrogenase [Bradyrhizobium sp. AZCC 1678]|uniref:acyl-CoA dehydrogenase family protein n=1 Tax=Bradyrhizobium sp. AZCC 1678 TaxID=3117030 RepID=UPI002FF35BA1
MSNRIDSSAIWPSTDELISRECLEEIRSRAAGADLGGEIPASDIELLRRVGYLGFPIPKEFGGAGAGMVECCAIQMRLGAANAGLAIGLNMHLFTVGVLLEHWRRHRDLSWVLMEAIATQNRVVASAFAEPSLGGSVLRSTCTAVPSKGGYVVSGKKVPCSLAGRSDLICLQMETNEDRPDRLIVALIPSVASGVHVEYSWNALGMRASESNTIILKDCFVPNDLVFHRCVPGSGDDPVFAASICWFCLLSTSTYVGLAHSALAVASELLRSSHLSHLGVKRDKNSSHQGWLGDLVADLTALECACFGLASRYDHDHAGATKLLPLALSVKQSSIDRCSRIVAQAMEMVGGRAYAKDGLLARLLRDVNAIGFHPPTRLASRQMLGKWMLGLPFSFELSE